MPKNDLIVNPKELRNQIIKTKMALMTNRIKDTNVVKKLKIQLARVLTSLREKELHADH